MTATLTVNRETSFLMELRRGTFEIRLDGAVVGSINRNETFETPIEAGRHELQVRTGRYSSRPSLFEVADDNPVNFRCNGARVWPVYLASFLVPTLALTLKRE